MSKPEAVKRRRNKTVKKSPVAEGTKFYRIKGVVKELVPVKARKLIAKKYYGKKLASKKKYVVKRKQRKSIEVGKVAIILTGNHMGKRCIITKVLDSGLLAVVGPYKINGVPLKRVDPRYIVVTSTNIFNLKDFSAVKEDFLKLTEKVDDSIFITSRDLKNKKKKLMKNKKDALFMSNVLDHLKKLAKEDPTFIKQKAINEEISNLITPAIKQNKIFTKYIKSRFTLRNNMALHKLKF
ncbi:60S ribosomal protein L6-2, putative [Hepatocystis sp. ex Piliocolobus tephrosceles]|nr:60S ribosomal protein L6-2, putative [Hepatocystis sp. ex Piliocolobus tephrosceles]